MPPVAQVRKKQNAELLRKLAAFQEQTGMTCTQIGAALGSSAASVYRWTHGTMGVHPGYVDRIKRLLGLDA